MSEYYIEFLFDSGVKEIYKSGEVTEKEINDFYQLIYDSFKEGKSGVLKLPSDTGVSYMVNLQKIARVHFELIK